MAPEGKIKSKDLTYDASLPPFLQRLHAQKAGSGGGDPDRHERQIARPKKAQTVDEDDGPTIVDESGETVSKEDMDTLTTEHLANDAPALGERVRGPSIGDGEPSASGALPDENRKSEQKVTDGTATKKRKAAKVVGDDEVDGDVLVADRGIAKAAKKVRKKAKPIKLAFDNDDDAEGD